MNWAKEVAFSAIILLLIILAAPLIFLGLLGIIICYVLVNPAERVEFVEQPYIVERPVVPKDNRIYIEIPREKLYGTKFSHHNRINKLVNGMTVDRQFWHGDYTLN